MKFLLRSGKVKGDGMYWAKCGLDAKLSGAQRFDTWDEADRARSTTWVHGSAWRIVRLLSPDESKAKAIKAATSYLQKRIEDMEALFQSTHGCHWSWVHQATRADGLQASLVATANKLTSCESKLIEAQADNHRFAASVLMELVNSAELPLIDEAALTAKANQLWPASAAKASAPERQHYHVTTADVKKDPKRIVDMAIGNHVHISDRKGRVVGTLSIPTDRRT